MASGYNPKQRRVPARILTTAGWMEATFLVLEKGRFLDQLEAVEEFYNVADASMMGIETTMPSLALQRDAIELIAPQDEPELLATRIPNSQQHAVFVLFDGGVIHGTIEFLKNTRLSDFVTKQRGFILLRNCRLTMGPMFGDDKQTRTTDALLVNINHIIGISETEPL